MRTHPVLRGLSRLLEGTAIAANVAGTLVVLGLVAIVNFDVVARGLFNAPFRGAYEVVQFSMVLIVFLQLPDVCRVDRLTRSDGLMLMLGGRRPTLGRALRRAVNAFSMAVMAQIAYAISPEFLKMWETGDFFGIPGVFTAPWWPVKLVIFASAALCAALFARKARTGAARRWPPAPIPGRSDVSPIEIGSWSVLAIVLLIYVGVYIPIALTTVSVVAIWLMRDNFDLAVNLLKIAVGDSVM